MESVHRKGVTAFVNETRLQDRSLCVSEKGAFNFKRTAIEYNLITQPFALLARSLYRANSQLFLPNFHCQCADHSSNLRDVSFNFDRGDNERGKHMDVTGVDCGSAKG